MRIFVNKKNTHRTYFFTTADFLPNIKLSRELFASRLELVVRRRPNLPYSVCTTHVSALCHYRFVAFFAYITEPLFISGVFRREYDTNSLFNFFTANIANHKHLLSGGLVDRPRVNLLNICFNSTRYSRELSKC
jgi:hypothetical protein